MSETEMLQVMDAPGKGKGKAPAGLKGDDLKAMFRAMFRTRLLDQRGMNLQRQGRIGFYVPSFGQEASQIGAGYAMQDQDILFPSYRVISIALLRNVDLNVIFNQAWGNAKDLCKGRQMPNHYAIPDIGWQSISSPIGTQISHAVGAARAAQIRGEDKISWAWFGDGGTSSNDFHAGMNFAGVWKSPCIFMCENNHWAISVPQEMQTASQSFAAKAVAYGMPGIRVDGNDVLAVYEACREARERAANGGGPTLIETVTFRMGPHSSSDDPSKYQAQELFEHWQEKDPIDRFRAWLKGKRLWTQKWEDELKEEMLAEIAAAVEAAESTPAPDVETLFDDVWAEVPPMLVEQREALLDQIRRSGDIEDTGGAFPL
ncbi:MAG: thiamine pyrophosphate-dependent dehydrogenase E1 component subunit alpha [Planctomycetota bacterium]|nr:thiamine pyrophosphate-dependent dehydrogenase E1 component subunit alpha [Planctomycetota bacterium]